MARTLLVCALATVCALPAAADDKPKSNQTVVRFTGKPMAQPRPALKYQLLPELRELSPGNPIQGYLTCFMEQHRFFYEKELREKRDQLLNAPLSELPDLRDYGGSATRQADHAARLDNPDWQVLLRAKTDGIGFRMPGVQEMRNLSQALRLRFRGEVATRRFDDALTTAKTMFALARHLDSHPTLIADLVAVAIAAQTFSVLEELMQQPGCPNLYWALTDLPDPLIDLRKGFQGEVVLVEGEFAGLDAKAPMSDEQLQRTVPMLKHSEKDVAGLSPGLDKLVKDEGHVKQARQRLLEAGMGEQVKNFPPLQVVLLDEHREYELRRDDMLKWIPLPYWQTAKGIANEPPPSADSLLAKLLLPAVLTVRMAGARLERRIAILRHVEAVRMYAAEHDGKLPASLSDCTVPLPVDPLFGKPFGYSVEGDTAVIMAPPPPGADYKPDPRWTNPYDLRYVVTITK
jgi:hypothetical protein